MKRGALIVIEGVDRTGKSTQCKLLVNNLKSKNINAEYANFPDRNTIIGKSIDSYLSLKSNLPDEAIHLLFSANRWEKINHLIKKLESGVTLIVDRYCYSGVAFSAAKGLDLNWCKAPDAGLPKPDIVFFLTMPLEKAQERIGYGCERYEIMDFQKKVVTTYLQLADENWDIVDASKSINDVQAELLPKVENIVNSEVMKPLSKLWTDLRR